MFESRKKKNGLQSAVAVLELIYHATVRNVRKTHGNALIGLLMNMLQTVVLVGAFYAMFTLLGMRGSAIRGDFLLYVMSGIFLFLTHTKALGAVVSSEGPASPMMNHAPMSTAISIASSALAALYIQILSLSAVLFIYHVAFTRIYIQDPAGAVGMIILSWFSGVAGGMVFLAIRPWFPGFTQIASTVYSRANMIGSGKMFVANSLPQFMLPFFIWNPLFHCIDQARGFIFANYTPHNSSVTYPVYFSLALIMIGLMGEFYTRKHASVSWSARR